MRKTMNIITLATIITLASLPVHAAAYMKFEGVKGSATAAGKEKWIELGSIQFMTATGGKGTMNEKLGRLCSAPVQPTIVVDVDGKPQTLRNVKFNDCQEVGNQTNFTFTMAADPNARTYDHTLGGGTFASNAKLTGLGSAPTAIQLESLTINGTGARMTLTKAGQGTLVVGAHQKLPTLIVELTTGQKWTFYNVELENTLITSATGDAKNDRPSEVLTLNFVKVEGPSTGFQAHR